MNNQIRKIADSGWYEHISAVLLYIEIIKVMDLDVLPNAQCTQFHGKWAEKDRNFGVTLMIEPVFMRATREGVKIIVVLIGLVVGGLLYIAFPLLIVVGIIALAASRS